MVTEYENLIGEAVRDGDVMITDSAELLGVCDGLSADELREVWEENPELLGGFFSRLRKRIRARRSYRKSLKGLSRRARRKALRTYRRRVSKAARKSRRVRRRKRLKKLAMAFIPGGRIARLIIRSRAKRAGMSVRDYLRKRRAGRRSRRAGRRSARRERFATRRMARAERRGARRGISARGEL